MLSDEEFEKADEKITAMIERIVDTFAGNKEVFTHDEVLDLLVKCVEETQDPSLVEALKMRGAIDLIDESLNDDAEHTDDVQRN